MICNDNSSEAKGSRCRYKIGQLVSLTVMADLVPGALKSVRTQMGDVIYLFLGERACQQALDMPET